jgi:predicted TIM-barrel enzyme
MSLFGTTCARCGKRRTRETYEGLATCDTCKEQIEGKLAAARETRRLCPVDGAEMGKEVVLRLVLDRCPTCRGVWLDAGELERLNGEIAYEACAAMVYGMRPPA